MYGWIKFLRVYTYYTSLWSWCSIQEASKESQRVRICISGHWSLHNEFHLLISRIWSIINNEWQIWQFGSQVTMEIMVWIVAKPSWNQQRILHCSFTFVQGFFFPFLVSMKRHFLFELVYLHDYSIRVLLTYKILVTAINAILVISSRWFNADKVDKRDISISQRSFISFRIFCVAPVHWLLSWCNNPPTSRWKLPI